MRRIWLAIRAFFYILFNAQVAERVREALETGPADKVKAVPPPPPKPKVEPPSAPKAPLRSEAVTLLATLQREARFVDFMKESLEGYTDAQIGAAVRDVHRDCSAALERMFALRAIHSDDEGAEVELPANADAGRYRLTGNVTDQPQPRGRLVHSGWEATKCEMPTWSGSEAAARVVAPVEVEVR